MAQTVTDINAIDANHLILYTNLVADLEYWRPDTLERAWIASHSNGMVHLNAEDHHRFSTSQALARLQGTENLLGKSKLREDFRDFLRESVRRRGGVVMLRQPLRKEGHPLYYQILDILKGHRAHDRGRLLIEDE